MDFKELIKTRRSCRTFTEQQLRRILTLLDTGIYGTVLRAKGILPAVKEAGLILAVQGCEHINRSLCCSRATMKKYGLQQVWVKPWLHAGGACVTGAYERIEDAVMVESVNGQATLGIDIGDTLIGMHLHCVAVPVHSPLRRIGEANLVMAFSRPKYVGGPRAQYDNVPVGSDAHTQKIITK